MYYSSNRSDDRPKFSQVMELFISSLAGGETSGTVIQKAGYKAFWIGKSIAPGGPILYPLENRQLQIALKSGNFGNPEFFIETLKEQRGCSN